MTILTCRILGVLSCCVLLIACASAPTAQAGPTDEEIGDLAEALDTRITNEFLDTPLARILEVFQRESGVLIVASESTGGRQITLNLEQKSVREALDLIALTTDLDWVIDSGVVMVSTDAVVRGRRVTSAVIDIRGLLIHVPNYTGPRLGIDGALSNTSSGGSNSSQAAIRTGGGGGGGSLFGDDNDISEDVLSRDEVVQHIIELIQDTVGEPDWWLDEDFTIRELSGQLVIRATPEAHEDIKEMLNQLGQSQGKMIVIEGQYYLVPRTKIDALDGGLVMDRDTYNAFVESFEDDGIQRLAAVRTICYNGQRVYVYAGGDESFLSDVEPIPDTGSIDPTLSVLRSGVSLDIQATITMDNQSVSVAVRSDLITATALGHIAIPVSHPGGSSLPIRTSGSVSGQVRPDRGNDQDGNQRLSGGVNSNGRIDLPGEPGPTGEVILDKPEQDVVNYRTNVRIPDGGALILTGSSNMFEGIDADKFEVVLVLRTHIILPGGEE